MIGETASTEEGGDKAAWIQDAFARLTAAYPQIRAITWFNINKETDWRIDSAPQSWQTFPTAVSGPGWADHWPITGRTFRPPNEARPPAAPRPSLSIGRSMTNTPLDLPRQLDLEQLIAEEAHDLRSPYNLIIGFSKMLQSGPNPNYPPELQREDAEAIYRGGQRALLLMNSLIDIARLKRHEKEAGPADTEITLLLTQSLAFWKKFNLASKLQTEYQINTTVTHLTTDEILLRQILCSFIMVIAQYVDPQATVTLTVEDEPDWLIFTVAGVGAKAQPLSPLDLHMQGYLGRALVELLLGELRVTEETDDGAVIQFALPRTVAVPSDSDA